MKGRRVVNNNQVYVQKSSKGAFVSVAKTANNRNGAASTMYSYRLNSVQGTQIKPKKAKFKYSGSTVGKADDTGNNSARYITSAGGAVNKNLVPSPEFKQQIAGRNHHKSSVESSKVPRSSHLLSAKTSERVDVN